MTIGKRLAVTISLIWVAGCSSEPAPAQLSGTVTFKGQAVPAGWISFTPEVGTAGHGSVKVLQIKDGKYDSKDSEAPLVPGTYLIRIAAFDGQKVPFYGQGKQIFNPVDDMYTVPDGASTKDFVVPDSAGENVKIQPTADT